MVIARQVQQRNKLKRIYSGETTIYRVRRNDNLTNIAQRFDTNIDEMLRLNGIGNANKLYPGQKLKVPHIKVLAAASKEHSLIPSSRMDKGLHIKTNRPRSAKIIAHKETDSNVKIILIKKI